MQYANALVVYSRALQLLQDKRHNESQALFLHILAHDADDDRFDLLHTMCSMRLCEVYLRQEMFTTAAHLAGHLLASGALDDPILHETRHQLQWVRALAYIGMGQHAEGLWQLHDACRTAPASRRQLSVQCALRVQAKLAEQAGEALDNGPTTNSNASSYTGMGGKRSRCAADLDSQLEDSACSHKRLALV